MLCFECKWYPFRLPRNGRVSGIRNGRFVETVLSELLIGSRPLKVGFSHVPSERSARRIEAREQQVFRRSSQPLRLLLGPLPCRTLATMYFVVSIYVSKFFSKMYPSCRSSTSCWLCWLNVPCQKRLVSVVLDVRLSRVPRVGGVS